ncbi:hypothetical protein TW65_05551 [Stemphylium lycopersici]|uniref:Epidermal growth factor receptor-like transmembrane-juxtamembrane segment domain-containing protein n=1 Tax=Stemphylium lycopersici TaxID=183478 RepID=A0A364MW69_STELY|nr:hypothetical protein TW65_05551 [Stemphylium lycopersici]RAR05345.1 hypothetical protein DDE83_007421 [Stemphylium lycopersici]
MAMPRAAFICFFALLAVICTVRGSTIATFTDAECQKSFQNVNAENGYPSGICSRLAEQGRYGSFQVVALDEGCSATIYGSDSEPYVPCSSTVLEFAQIATCYNTSWVYYSIDTCTPPSSASPSPTLSPPKKDNGPNTGAIAGGVVGGVGGAAVIALAAFFFLRRRKRQPSQQRADGTQEAGGIFLNELPHAPAKSELDNKDVLPLQELGRNSVYIPPVELQANEVGANEVPDSQILPGEK